MNQKALGTPRLQIFFKGAGLDGEMRYELKGVGDQSSDLLREQLHDILKNEYGVAEQTIAQYCQQIDELPTKTVTGDGRPAVNIQV